MRLNSDAFHIEISLGFGCKLAHCQSKSVITWTQYSDHEHNKRHTIHLQRSAVIPFHYCQMLPSLRDILFWLLLCTNLVHRTKLASAIWHVVLWTVELGWIGFQPRVRQKLSVTLLFCHYLIQHDTNGGIFCHRSILVFSPWHYLLRNRHWSLSLIGVFVRFCSFL